MARRLTRVVTTPAAARIPREWTHPFVSLLTDWGLRDPSPAIARGVILGIAPEALIVDISHKVEKFNIRHGALLLWCAVPFLPVGAHVAVIDPGVGTARRPVAIEVARGDLLIGPDNGVLLAAAERLGGIVRVHSIENPQYRLPVLSSTFHGRDVFAPAAAHLALGVPLEAIGSAIDPRTLTALDWPPVVVRDGELETTVIYRDTFGNLKLAGLTADLHAAIDGLEHGDHLMVEVVSRGRHPRHEMAWSATFGAVESGGYLLYEDSYGRICIARNQGNAAKSLPLAEGAVLRISRVEAATASEHAADHEADRAVDQAAEGDNSPGA
jgi:S-adenosylmethionine hydrolase